MNVLSMGKHRLIVFACMIFSMFALFFLNPYSLHAGSTPTKSPTNSTDTDMLDSVTVGSDGTLTFSGNLQGSGDGTSAINSIIVKYRLFISGVAGLAAVSMLLFFIIHLGKLGATATNSKARSEIIVGLVWSAVATAGLGSVAIIVGFFYRIFL